MKKSALIIVVLGLCVVVIVILFFSLRTEPNISPINLGLNVSFHNTSIVGITPEQRCANGQVKDRGFTGTEYVYSGCHAVPGDYNKSCTNSIDCTNKCITTLEMATAASCVTADGALKKDCTMNGFCSATYDSGGFIEIVKGVPTQRVDE